MATLLCQQRSVKVPQLACLSSFDQSAAVATLLCLVSAAQCQGAAVGQSAAVATHLCLVSAAQCQGAAVGVSVVVRSVCRCKVIPLSPCSPANVICYSLGVLD